MHCGFCACVEFKSPSAYACGETYAVVYSASEIPARQAPPEAQNRRILTHFEAERLREEEGRRRHNQQHDAEKKIKSIHSRMAELVCTHIHTRTHTHEHTHTHTHTHLLSLSVSHSLCLSLRLSLFEAEIMALNPQERQLFMGREDDDSAPLEGRHSKILNTNH